MEVLWAHIITWIVMTITVLMALFVNKYNKVYEMITRVGYIVIIITGIIMFPRAWQVEPVLLIIKVVLALILIACAEIAFARKNTGRLTTQAVWAVIICLIVVAIVGFALAGWYPFVQH